MANKQLTAKVRLDASQAHRTIDKLVAKINQINNVINKSSGSSGLEKKIQRQVMEQEKYRRAVAQSQLAEQKVATEKKKTEAAAQRALQLEEARARAIENTANNVANDAGMSESLSSVEGILSSINQQNGKWKLDMEGLVSSVGSLIPGYGGIISACAPIISQVAEWLGITEFIEKVVNGIVTVFKEILNIVTFGAVKLRELKNSVSEWWEEQKNVARQTKITDGLLDGIWNKLKGIAATYLGIMGAEAVITISDTLTGAENRLNYFNAKNLGDAGYDASGDFSVDTINATTDAMNNMYSAAQRARTSYSGLMKNVSKSLTLAGEAFDNDTNKAVAFQETLAKAFAISGSTAEEMSSSLLQMNQALGHGKLQGDELKTLSENASLAYKKIEEYVQGLYGAAGMSEYAGMALKELGADGLVTSEMVVAAILHAKDEIDRAFDDTKWTFAQFWEEIKNSASRAFQPLMNTLNNILQSLVDSGILKKIETFLMGVANAIESVVTWVQENWPLVKDIIVGGLIVLGSYFAVTGAIAVFEAIVSAAAWIAVNWPILLIVGTLALLGWAFYKAGDDGVDVCNILVQALKWVGLALFVIGILTGNITNIAIGGVLSFISVVMNNLNPTTGRIIAMIVKVALTLYNAIANAINNFFAMSAVLNGVASNIGTFFHNLWIDIQVGALDAANGILDAFSSILPTVNGILKALGQPEINVKASKTAANILRSQKREYVDLGKAAATTVLPKLSEDTINNIAAKAGYMFSSKEAFNKTINGAMLDLKNGLFDDVDGWWGEAEQKLNEAEMLSKYGTTNPTLDQIKDANDGIDAPANALGDLGGLNKDVGNISDSVGNIEDTMELTAEDLEYLRKIADMEWKKEYTTASITVDMSNYNTINGESDLDGIVTKLSEKLYEEMNSVANGVYA